MNIDDRIERATRLELIRVMAGAVAEAMKVPVEDREFIAMRFLVDYGMEEGHARALARDLVAEIPKRL